MGVSFKVSKTGTRFRPKPVLPHVQSGVSVDDVAENSKDTYDDNDNSSHLPPTAERSTRKSEGHLVEANQRISRVSNSAFSSEETIKAGEDGVSFTLNLFPDGYSIGRSSENDAGHPSDPHDVPKLLHPYDRTSESLFSAIESGRLPGDILDDIPCKYVDGTLICEVRDFRKFSSEKGPGVLPIDGTPIISRVRLRMSLENVVKDIPSISDDSWTYGDLMEVESQILKALQPQLLLDPTPKLDRLSDSPVSAELKLVLSSLRRKRLRQIPDVTVTSSNRIHGKKVYIDRVPESSNCRLGDSGIISSNAMGQLVPENLMAQNLGQGNMLALRPKSFVLDSTVQSLSVASHQSRYQMGVGAPRSMPEPGLVSVNIPGASPASQDMMISYAANANSITSLHGRRENQDGQMSPLSNFNRRVRPTSMILDGIQHQQIGPHMDGVQGSEINWQNTMFQQQAIPRRMQYTNSNIQKTPPQNFEGALNQDAGAIQFAGRQQSIRYGPKEEQIETEKLDGSDLNRNRSEMQMEMDASHLDPSRLQQRLPQHAFLRTNFPQPPWNSLSQHMEKDTRKEEQLQKRKSVQSPRLSTGGLPQSPLSTKSGEFSSGSAGPNFGAAAALGVSQKEKAAMTSGPAVGGTSSLTSSANDSSQRQHQAQVATKRRSNSLPRTPAMSGVGSPASVSNMNLPLNASSPSVGTPPLADQSIIDRFSKIEVVTLRHQLNCKKADIDDCPRKSNTFTPQNLMLHLSNVSTNEDFKDDACAKSLSKSLVGGSINICKVRVLNFLKAEHIVQGNVPSLVPRVRSRMIMSEKPFDGTVAMIYGEIEEADFLALEDHFPTLPNVHFADLLATQFCKLMENDEGFMMEDYIQPKPNRVNLPSNSQPCLAGSVPNNSGANTQQFAEPVSINPSNQIAKPINSGNASINSSQHLATSAGMLPPGNPQSLQMSQGLISGISMPPRPQQTDQQLVQQPQQQQSQQQQNQQSLIQQQNPQFQRSPMMLGANPLSHLSAIGPNSGMQLGNHMVNKPSPLQYQLLQRQQQQPQRKMMMGIGTAVSMGNSIAGLGGLGSAMGMGTGRGIAGTGISASMASIPGIGNMGQNSMNLSQAPNISNVNVIGQQLRNGTITPAQAQLMASKLRMANRVGLSSISGMSGVRPMHPGSASVSMLGGQTLNRPNTSALQRAPIGPMAPPKLMAGMNLYMNQQQQPQSQLQQSLQLQQQQQQQQQQQLQQQHLQQLQLQQETTSPLQAVVSPPQVGSPSTIGVPQMNQQSQQQQTSSQQMNQRTPMSPQMSSGAIHALSAGNPEACPASPQLSSQTLGSVGSINTSPMELQGVNKSNSVSNV